MTGKSEYMEAAWRMFQAVEKISRTKIAAAAIADVTIKFEGEGNPGGKGEGEQGQKMDSMESFWLAETLKYFYLCFEEWDVVSLDEWEQGVKVGQEGGEGRMYDISGNWDE